MTSYNFDADSNEEDQIPTSDIVTEIEESLDILEETVTVEEETIKSPELADEVPAMIPVEDGVIGTGKKKRSTSKPKKVEEKKDQDPGTVALFANRNLSWQGVGKLQKGYNLVSSLDAGKWLTLEAVRLVDPEEIRTNLG